MQRIAIANETDKARMAAFSSWNESKHNSDFLGNHFRDESSSYKSEHLRAAQLKQKIARLRARMAETNAEIDKKQAELKAVRQDWQRAHDLEALKRENWTTADRRFIREMNSKCN